MKLAGKIAVVTGGARGIGAGYRALSGSGGGRKLALLDVDVSRSGKDRCVTRCRSDRRCG